MGQMLGYVEIITSQLRLDPKIYPASSKDYPFVATAPPGWLSGSFLADASRIPWNPHGKDHADLGVQVAINSASSAKLMCPSQRWVSDFIQHVPKQHMKSFHHPSFGIMKWFVDLLCHLCPTSWIAPAPGRVCLDNRQNVENWLFWSILKSLPKGRKSILALCLHLQLIHESNHPTQSIPSSQFKFIRSQVFYVRRKPGAFPRRHRNQHGLSRFRISWDFDFKELTSRRVQQSNSNAARPGIQSQTPWFATQPRYPWLLDEALWSQFQRCLQVPPKNRKSQNALVWLKPTRISTITGALMQIVGPGSMGLSSASRIGPPGASIPRIFIAATNG